MALIRSNYWSKLWPHKEVICGELFSRYFLQCLMDHFMSMDGGWSWAFRPYYEMNVTQDFHNPKADDLFEIEDMFCEFTPT